MNGRDVREIEDWIYRTTTPLDETIVEVVGYGILDDESVDSSADSALDDSTPVYVPKSAV